MYSKKWKIRKKAGKATDNKEACLILGISPRKLQILWDSGKMAERFLVNAELSERLKLSKRIYLPVSSEI